MSKPQPAQGGGGAAQQGMLLDSNTIRVYYNLANSQSVGEGILQRLGLGGTVRQLRERMAIEADYETGILTITARQNDGALARDVAQAFIESLREQSEKLAMGAEIRMIDGPKAPAEPAGPNIPLNMLLAAAGGLMAGLLLALILQAGDLSAGELPELAGLPSLELLGCLPKLTRRRRKKALLTLPGGLPGEAMKIIRTKLLYRMESRAAKSVLVTSPRAAEGKTTLAFNLALSAARLGKRVLVLDCNFRRPALFRLAHDPAAVGVVRPLGDDSQSIVACPTAAPGVDFVSDFPPSGELADGAGCLQIAAFVEAMKRSYDLILIDSPPLLGYADALMLAGAADGVVLVADYRHLAAQVLEQCAGSLGRIGAPVLGLVVNLAPPAKAFS